MLNLTEKQKEIRECYKVKFYNNNDDAHKIDHADEVYQNALNYVEKNCYFYNSDIVFMMCYIHDIYAGINRDLHHLLAFEYVRNKSDKYLKEMSGEEIFLISEAVLKHRASSNMNTRSEYDTILRIADRGVPDFNKVLERTLQYTKSKYSDNIDFYVKKHIKEKYSRNGYAFNDFRYVKTYEKELEEFWKQVDDYLKE